jgi:hypothetical protein
MGGSDDSAKRSTAAHPAGNETGRQDNAGPVSSANRVPYERRLYAGGPMITAG